MANFRTLGFYRFVFLQILLIYFVCDVPVLFRIPNHVKCFSITYIILHVLRLQKGL